MDSTCPVCGCKRFYVKDPDDQYETYEFECKDGKVSFDDRLKEHERPEVHEGTETYCNACAWHDKFAKTKQR
jgi:hypothetical protein